ncbi:MAG: nucleotidyl transferase AbiEii/AbiGii toxin family protein [Paludibacteraceae bacterium]|nr:nucleotidyl transferase AbiEii/AbiGii toxin family protein [Paludibacteraceae bacterium]
MKLYKETISPNLLGILEKLMESETLKDFCLVGGTALSLQRGHRRSIDIDLFTGVAYSEIDTKEIKLFIESSFPVHEGTDSLDEAAMGYNLFLGNGVEPPIKVDLFYTEPFIFPIHEINGIRMADQREIAAMKMLAIGGPIQRQKDYWDIHDMLSDFSLDEMIQWGLQRNKYSLSKQDILNGFDNIDNIEESPEGIDSLKSGEYWELKVLDLKEEVEQYKAKSRRKNV